MADIDLRVPVFDFDTGEFVTGLDGTVKTERRKAFGSKESRRRSYSLRPVDNKCRQCFRRRRGR